MKLNKRQIWAILFCVYLAAVFYLCFMKTDDMPQIRPDIFGIPVDKLVHFLMFFPLPVAGYEAFKPKNEKMGLHLLVLTVIYISGIGIAMGTEHIQGLLEYRSNDVNDFHADLIGMTCAAICTAIYIVIRQKRN